jgi:hypothetical protein
MTGLRIALVPCLLGLGWLGAAMWSAYRTIAGTPGGTSVSVAQAAIALPTATTASVLAGTAAGLLVLGALRPRGRAVWLTAAIGAAGGLLIGLVAATAVLLAYGTGSIILAIAATLALGAVLGGTVVAAGPTTVAPAALTGALAALAIGLVKGLFAGQLPGLFGAGATAASQLDADARLQLTVSALAGIAGGLASFAYLRRSRPETRWPEYLVAGIAAGTLLLGAEVAVRIGGAQLTSVAQGASPADRAVLEYLAGERLNHALIVLFVGGVVALLAVGRTLPAKGSAAQPSSSDQVVEL